MAEALADLWDKWTRGPGAALVVGSFAVLLGLWVAAVILTARQAHRRWRPMATPTFSVLLIPFALSAVGLARPDDFHVWVLAGLALAPLLALVFEMLARRIIRRCEQFHLLAPAWSFCPQCPSPDTVPVSGLSQAPPTIDAGFVSRGVATLLRRPAPLPYVGGEEDARPVDDVLVRLLPAMPGAAEVVVRRPGASIGRDPAAEICIDDPTVSWEHAKIVTRDGVPALMDLGSSNGTYLNGERVEHTLLLADDVLQLGDVVFRVVRP